MLKVGIHKNLVLSKVGRNQKAKDSLQITLKATGEVDLLAALNSTKTDFKAEGIDIVLFPPSWDFGGTRRENSAVLDDIMDFKSQLQNMLEMYMTEDKIKWNMTFGTGITSITSIEDLAAQLNEDRASKMYNNLVDQFLTQVKPFVGDNGKKTNWVLVRRSKANHQPTLRKRYVKNNPFVEPADVPTSKLRFTKYELENGLNVPDAIEKPSAPSQQDAQAADKLFATN